jgi:hypothetical protein
MNEDFADNLGLHVAHSIFSQSPKREGRQEKQRIKGLEQFTDEQMFFIAFAFVCLK